MGNRAVITFDQKPTKNSVGIYVHWNGGPESILSFAEAAEKFGVRDNEDNEYQVARFIQIIGNFLGGTISLGVGILKNLDCDNGNHGVYIISRKNGKITISQDEKGTLYVFKKLQLAKIKKSKSWEPILNQVIKSNEKFFSNNS